LEDLDSCTDLHGANHPETLRIAHQLGLALWRVGDLDAAAGLLHQAMDRFNSTMGVNHPKSLAAKGDLAAVLFDLGRDVEAGLLEREAFESAQAHLGKSHSVTNVLAWNRALNYERSGDLDSARIVFTQELSWLLVEDPSGLETDQNAIRGMLADRLNWDGAKAC
jgi:hypothetical protein